MLKLTTKTEYGLMCLLYMAKNADVRPITIKELSNAEQYSPTYVEKILQLLRSADIVRAQHGNQGGYTLAKQPKEITLKEVVTALEGTTFQVFCEPKQREQIVCTHFNECSVRPVWEGARNVLDEYFESTTLDQILKLHPNKGCA